MQHRRGGKVSTVPKTWHKLLCVQCDVLHAWGGSWLLSKLYRYRRSFGHVDNPFEQLEGAGFVCTSDCNLQRYSRPSRDGRGGYSSSEGGTGALSKALSRLRGQACNAMQWIDLQCSCTIVFVRMSSGAATKLHVSAEWPYNPIFQISSYHIRGTRGCGSSVYLDS